MSGHNKWSTIKHRKGAQDAKKSKIFTKVIKEISVAVKMGSADTESNPRLRAALSWARSVNMTNSVAQKAIDKAAGAGNDSDYMEIIYEGYGPHQIAVIIECLSDNKNRTASSIRTIFSKKNGNLGATNSVMFQFERKGVIEIPKSACQEEELMDLVIEAGADDFSSQDAERHIIFTEATELMNVRNFLEAKQIEIINAQLDFIPTNKQIIDDAHKAGQVIAFIDALEDDDDVQKVYTNFDISENILAELNS